MVQSSIKTFNIRTFFASISVDDTGQPRPLTPATMAAAVAALPVCEARGVTELIVQGRQNFGAKVVAALCASGISIIRAPRRSPLYKSVVERPPKTSVDHTTRPSSRAEIDQFLCNVNLVDSKTGKPLNRPLLTIVFDPDSGLVFGYHLSFAGSSSASAVAAIRRAFRLKDL